MCTLHSHSAGINIVATVQLNDDDGDELPSAIGVLGCGIMDKWPWSRVNAELVWLRTPALLWWWPVTMCSPACCIPSRFEWRLRWEAALYLDSGRQGNTSAMLTVRCLFVSDVASEHCVSARQRRDAARAGVT